MRSEPSTDIDPQHPMFGVFKIKYDVGAGAAEIKFDDGRVVRANVRKSGGAEYIRDTVLDVRTSTLHVRLLSGFAFTMKIGTVRTLVDRPVVYLDQNHWIDMARYYVGSPAISDERKGVCRRIAELAEGDQIILPVSAAHLGEIAKRATGNEWMSRKS